jgi:DNA invertase Pin-like site-specific DNA recombinase
LNHLIVGTQQQNIQDAMERGRWMTSKRIAGNIKRRKLSDTDVETIRSLRAQGWTNTALASKYAVNQSTISRIVSNLRRVSERV